MFVTLLLPELREPVMRSALRGDAPLLRELGLRVTRSRAVELEPLPGTLLGTLLGTMQTCFEVTCP